MKSPRTKATILLLGAALAACGSLRADQTAEDITERAGTLRPRPESLKWQEIPWLTNLRDALKVATEERRPVFLWGSDDEPLVRC